MSESSIQARIALVGNPNAGKTTLFNSLTGQNQKVGNYTGATVSRKSGTFLTPHGHQLELIDLPGAYSLQPNSPDEKITRDVLVGEQEGEAPRISSSAFSMPVTSNVSSTFSCKLLTSGILLSRP